MISRLSSPSVCVIDDEPPDYQPILNALLKLGIACVHVHGDSASPLPPQPFDGLRIVFTDLYLSGSSGKTAAAHTANVFRKVVSADTAPVLVVIWSKHTDEKAGDAGVPLDDQPTAADLFKDALLEAEPLFRERLIFTEMAKPKPGGDRPDDTEWITHLQADILKKLVEFPACDLLWSWEALVREAGISVSKGLTALALEPVGTGTSPLDDKLKLVFRHLAKEQGGPDCSATSASRHLAAVLAQSLADELEHSVSLSSLTPHGAWLSDKEGLPETAPFACQLNGLLLTAAIQAGARPFVPGVIYKVEDAEKFKEVFGESPKELVDCCYNKLKEGGVWTKAQWREQVLPVLLEISPACDFHQGTRRQSLLIGGVLGPSVGQPHARTTDAYQTFPKFLLRWASGAFLSQDVFMVFCSRYKITLPPREEPNWLVPWFRLRELPTASLRNWHASHSARVGYVSLR